MSVPDDEAAELANDLAIANAQVKWMEAENERLRAALIEEAKIRVLVDEQAADEGLWFEAETCAEAYVQQALRRLHAAIEGECRPLSKQDAIRDMMP